MTSFPEWLVLIVVTANAVGLSLQATSNVTAQKIGYWICVVSGAIAGIGGISLLVV